MPCSNSRVAIIRRHLRNSASGLGYAVALFLSLRVAFSLFALLLSTVTPLYPPCTAGHVILGPGTKGAIMAMLGVWRQWDTCQYESIATNGYQSGSVVVAFFPLFPGIVRVVTELLGGNIMFAELIVSSLAYIAAMVGIHRLVTRDFDDTTAHRTALLLSTFPSAFYFFMPYTEALFLALAVWAMYSARQGALGWAIVAAFLASLTRTQGCLLAIPLVWEVIRQRQQFAANQHWLWRAALAALVPMSGIVGFVIYSKWAAGWTTFQAQATFWGASYQMPWTLFQHSWQGITDRGNIIEATNLGLLIVFILLFLAGLSRLPVSYSLYVAPQLFLLTIRQTSFTPLSSVHRYLLVLFPVFVVLALVLTNKTRRIAWLMTSCFLLVTLCYLFLLGTFVA
jgi:hypothetical protein